MRPTQDHNFHIRTLAAGLAHRCGVDLGVLDFEGESAFTDREIDDGPADLL